MAAVEAAAAVEVERPQAARLPVVLLLAVRPRVVPRPVVESLVVRLPEARPELRVRPVVNAQAVQAVPRVQANQVMRRKPVRLRAVAAVRRGTYRVKLTVGGKTLTTTLTVRADPMK